MSESAVVPVVGLVVGCCLVRNSLLAAGTGSSRSSIGLAFRAPVVSFCTSGSAVTFVLNLVFSFRIPVCSSEVVACASCAVDVVVHETYRLNSRMSNVDAIYF